MSSFNTGMRKQIETLVAKHKRDEQTRVEEVAAKERRAVAHRQYVSRFAALAGETVWVQWRRKDGTTTPPFKCYCTEVEPEGLIVQYDGNVERLRFSRRLIVQNRTQLELGAAQGKAKFCAKLYQACEQGVAETQKLANQVQEQMDKLQRQKEYLGKQLKETFGMLTRATGYAASIGRIPEREVFE